MPTETPDSGASASASPTLPAALQQLLGRYSLGPRWMVEPGPGANALAWAIQAALRAPNHGRMRPWRAVTIGPQQRPALAELFAQFARDTGKSEDEVHTERELGFSGKMLSGEKVRSPEIIAAFCDPGESLVGWISIGTPIKSGSPKSRKSTDSVLSFF